jgi:hypothetical protein
MDANLILEEGLGEGGHRRSLMEMAGLRGDSDSSYRQVRGQRQQAEEDLRTGLEAAPAPKPARAAAKAEPVGLDDDLPEMPKPSLPEVSDDDFLAMIRDDLEGKGGGEARR